MGGEVRPESTEPENSTPQQQKNWLKDRLSKVPKPVKIAGSVVGAGLAVIAGLTAADKLADSNTDDGDQPPVATETIKPTPSKTEAAITPIKTTPAVQSPSSSPTPTGSSISETPAPTQTAEITATPEATPQDLWVIDPKSPDSPITPEDWTQAENIVKSAWEKFPHIGKIKIVIVPGVASSAQFSQDKDQPSVIFFGAQGSITNILNELSGYFRLKLNYPTLSQYYSADTLSKMQELDPQIITPYANYSPENIFGEKMLHVSPFLRVAQTPYAFYVGQTIPLPSESGKINYPLEKPLFSDSLASPLYAKFAQETQGQINNSQNFENFAQDQNARLEQLKASSPLHKLAIEWLEANAPLLKYANILSGPGLQLDNKYLSGYFAEVLPIWENYALTRLFDQRDPGLLAMFTDQQIQDLAGNYQKLIGAVENEIFVRALNMQIQGVIKDPATGQYYQLIWQDFQ